MRPLAEIEKDAREDDAFSNGSEFEMWQAANCTTCIHDKAARNGKPENGCPLLMLAYVSLTPAEWLESANYPHPSSKYLCVECQHEDDGKDNPEPKPIPDPSGQLTLFPRDGFEGVRMFKPLAVEMPRVPEAVAAR